MTKIQDIDNLIAEFEKVAPAIEQLLEMAAGAADLRTRLGSAFDEASTKLANIDAARQKLGENMTDVRELRTSLESRISESKLLEKNVGDNLRKLKSEVLTEIGVLGESKSRLDAAIRNFSTEAARLLADIPNRLQALEADKQAAILCFKADVDNAIASLPSQFDQLKGQLTQTLQAHVTNEIQQFLSRQNTLVANLNQRIDALENLNRTQQESLLTILKRLEEMVENRKGGFLGMFR